MQDISLKPSTTQESSKHSDVLKSAVEQRKEAFKTWRELQVIAQRVGGDFGMSVEIGKPGGGSFFAMDEGTITLDPLHVIEDPGFAKFVASHEGAHRAITLYPEKLGLTKDQVKAYYGQLGFAFCQNILEDGAVNDWKDRTFPGLHDETRRFYRGQFKDQDAVLSTPEVVRVYQRLGRWPLFARMGSEILRDWQSLREERGIKGDLTTGGLGRFSPTVPPRVKEALDRVIDKSRECISAIPKPGSRDHVEIKQTGQKRFKIAAEVVYPEMAKLASYDLGIEIGRQAYENFRDKVDQLGKLEQELKDTQKQSGGRDQSEIQQEIDKLKEELKPFHGIPEKQRKEIEEKRKQFLKDQVKEFIKQAKEIAKQIKESQKKENDLKDASQSGQSIDQETQEALNDGISNEQAKQRELQDKLDESIEKNLDQNDSALKDKVKKQIESETQKEQGKNQGEKSQDNQSKDKDAGSSDEGEQSPSGESPDGEQSEDGEQEGGSEGSSSGSSGGQQGQSGGSQGGASSPGGASSGDAESSEDTEGDPSQGEASSQGSPSSGASSSAGARSSAGQQGGQQGGQQADGEESGAEGSGSESEGSESAGGQTSQAGAGSGQKSQQGASSAGGGGSQSEGGESGDSGMENDSSQGEDSAQSSVGQSSNGGQSSKSGGSQAKSGSEGADADSSSDGEGEQESPQGSQSSKNSGSQPGKGNPAKNAMDSLKQPGADAAEGDPQDSEDGSPGAKSDAGKKSKSASAQKDASEESGEGADGESLDSLEDDLEKSLEKKIREDGKGSPIPYDDLSDESQKSLEEMAASLEEEEFQRLKKSAEESLKELEDAISESLKGKLNQDPQEGEGEDSDGSDSESDSSSQGKSPPKGKGGKGGKGSDVKGKSESISGELRDWNEDERDQDSQSSGGKSRPSSSTTPQMKRSKAQQKKANKITNAVSESPEEFREASGQIAVQLEKSKHVFRRILTPTEDADLATGVSRGRLDMGKAMRVEQEPHLLPEMFIGWKDPIEISHAFGTLIDRSTSMAGDKAAEAYRASVFLAKLFDWERLKIANAQWVFSDGTYVIKDFKDKIKSLDVQKNLGAVLQVCGGTQDADAIWTAYCELIKRKEKFKFLPVISDSDSGTLDQLRSVLETIKEEGKVIVVHFGIGPGTKDKNKVYPYSFGNLSIGGRSERTFAKTLELFVKLAVRYPKRFFDYSNADDIIRKIEDMMKR